MTKPYKNTPAPFIASSRKRKVILIPMRKKNLSAWTNKQDKLFKTRIAQSGFTAAAGSTLHLHDKDGKLHSVAFGVSDPASYYDIAPAVKEIQSSLSEKTLKDTVFALDDTGMKTDELLCFCVGWGWSCYVFDLYKKNKHVQPALIWPKGVDKDKAEGMVQGVCLIRNLVNTPANDMGPKELTSAARALSKDYGAKISLIHDKDLKKDFPLIYTVGDASERRPSLIDIKWGKETDPKVTLVGKGVCFDTGGLDLKPPRSMLQMKKDMGGAAHVLGLAAFIMKTGLPIRLRVLIPAVENAVSGGAFRPRDVIKSRLGHTVEIGDTDAEGRLILADALTYACEDKPELLIDFATLTGSARSALGYDLPACFSNNDKLADEIKKVSSEAEDQVWPMPLWRPYKKNMNSDIADINNVGTGLGDVIHAALFLDNFVKADIDWLHLDVFSWEISGRPGRTKGGADTGMRAVYALLEKRYGQKKSKTKKKA